MTQASNDKQNWAKLVEEIQQAKAAFDASPSAAPSALPSAAVVEPNPEFKAVTPPAAPEIPRAQTPHHTPEIDPVAQRRELTTHGQREKSGFDHQELAENLNEFRAGDEHLLHDTPLVTKSSGIRSHLGWGVAGFMIGAICWHLIGFWSFVGDVVFSKDETTTIVERTVDAPAKPIVLSYVKKRASNGGVQTSQNCSAFYRDLDTGMARPAKCQNIVRSPGSIGAPTSR